MATLNFPKAVRIAMAQNGFKTQSELADKAQMKRQQLNQWLNENLPQHRVPNLKGVQRLAKVFGMKTSELIALGENE